MLVEEEDFEEACFTEIWIRGVRIEDNKFILWIEWDNIKEELDDIFILREYNQKLHKR
jgi:hypothetical protein